MAGVKQADVQLEPTPHVDLSDRSDPVAWAKSRQQAVREKIIAKERVNLLRLKVVDCYRKEGVNHYVNCKELTTKYLSLIQGKKYGTLKPAAGDAEDEEG
ncbi:unnamed protein product [Discosporangium mesarthrocarpum]